MAHVRTLPTLEIETSSLLPDLDEHLLGDLLGLRWIAQDAASDAEDGWCEPVVETSERTPGRHQRPGP